MIIRIGDTVRIKNLSRDFNGKVGVVVGKNGEYHYVDLNIDGEIVNIEAYNCEMDKQSVLPEELFNL